MECTDSLKALGMETARSLPGSARRLCMARTVKELGPGGQRRAERERGWSRVPIRQGPHALASGFTCLAAFATRGRTPGDAPWPNLLADIQALVDRQRQTDPPGRTTRLSTRLRAAEVRRQRSVQQGSPPDALPTVQTLTTQRNARGDYPQQVAQSQPQKHSRQPLPSSRR